jgi:hypothetical protein
MGLATAIIGSSLIGAGASIFGAKSANKAAERNQQAAQQNIGAANNAAYQELPMAFEDRMTGADYAASGMRAGQDAWHNQMSPISGQFQYGINEVRAGDPSYGGNTLYNRPTDFTRDTEIGGHWDDLRSQNFLQSPDYKFRQKEGLNLVEGSAAAQGGLYSGNTLRDITEFGSNLAAGEYGNWFNRQAGLADRDYGADVANYDRANQQFGQNYARDYDQFQGNFQRDYNVFADDWGRSQDRGRYLANMGAGAIEAGAGLDYGVESGIGQMYGDVYGQSAQDRINAGNTVSSNYMGGAGYAANQPYYSPWGGVNQAIQGGLQNYLWANAAGMMGGGGTPYAGGPMISPNTMAQPGGTTMTYPQGSQVSTFPYPPPPR